MHILQHFTIILITLYAPLTLAGMYQPKLMLNKGTLCFANAGLQSLFATKAFVPWLLQIKNREKTTLITALQSIATDYQNNKIKIVDPSPLYTTCYSSKEQKDAAEEINEILEKISKNITTPVQASLLLYQGTTIMQQLEANDVKPTKPILMLILEADPATFLEKDPKTGKQLKETIPASIYYHEKRWAAQRQSAQSQQYNLVSMAFRTFIPGTEEAQSGHYFTLAKYNTYWYRLDEPESYGLEETMPSEAQLRISTDFIKILLSHNQHTLKRGEWGIDQNAAIKARLLVYEREGVLSESEEKKTAADKDATFQKALQTLNSELNNLATALS